MVDKVPPVSKIIPLDNKRCKRPTKDDFKRMLNRPPDGPQSPA